MVDNFYKNHYYVALKTYNPSEIIRKGRVYWVNGSGEMESEKDCTVPTYSLSKDSFEDVTRLCSCYEHIEAGNCYVALRNFNLCGLGVLKHRVYYSPQNEEIAIDGTRVSYIQTIENCFAKIRTSKFLNIGVNVQDTIEELSVGIIELKDLAKDIEVLFGENQDKYKISCLAYKIVHYFLTEVYSNKCTQFKIAYQAASEYVKQYVSDANNDFQNAMCIAVWKAFVAGAEWQKTTKKEDVINLATSQIKEKELPF